MKKKSFARTTIMTAKTMSISLLAFSVSFCATVTVAVPEARGVQSAGRTYALLVNGISKDADERREKDRTLNAMAAYLRDTAGLDARRLTVLVGDDLGLADPNRTSTAENVKRAVGSLASVIRPEDRFIFHYIGLSNAVSDSLRFNLPGPDMTHEDLTHGLNGVAARTQLIVLDCPCAAVAAKALARPGRIVVCAATAKQAYSTGFTARFVPALTQMQNDRNEDGKISLLEAFTAAARETERWYRRIQCLPTETPCLEDDGDGVPSERPWRYEVDGGDGVAAAAFFFAAAP